MSKNVNVYSFVRPEKSPVFYGYIILFFGTIGVLSSIPGQTHGISVFTDPVKDALGLNRNWFSLSYTLGTIISSLFLTKAGKWYDRFGARWVAFFAAMGLALSLLLCSLSVNISSFVKAFLHFDHRVVPFSIMIVLFFFLRFSGQGVLTLASRNMIMKWFDAKRGRVNAISSIVVSVGFAVSPLLLSIPVDNIGWQNTWLFMAFAMSVLAGLFILFFRDNPEEHGLLPDGVETLMQDRKKEAGATKRQYTLKEAESTRSFWMYALMLAFNGFFATGVTFHIVSLFENAGYNRETALTIFLPISVVSLLVSLAGNTVSDWIKLKYLLYVQIVGGIIASLGLILLSTGFGTYLLIAGSGILGGLFAVFVSIVWPRFYGRQHLGAISGRAMSFVIFASAIAPTLFSYSLDFFHTYAIVGFISLIFLVVVAFLSIKANNPQ